MKRAPIKLPVREFDPAKTLLLPDTYKVGRRGRWEIKYQHIPELTAAYFGLVRVPAQYRHSYALRRDGETWMSTTPLECESLCSHNQAAFGHVVVLGLGMGMLLYNLARNPLVSKVTVVERDPNVIDAFRLFSGSEQWSGMDRVTITQADALAWRGQCDVLSADIWPLVGDQRIPGDLRTIRQNIQSQRMLAWSSELTYVDWCINKDMSPDAMTLDATAEQWGAETGHYIPKNFALPAFIASYICANFNSPHNSINLSVVRNTAGRNNFNPGD